MRNYAREHPLTLAGIALLVLVPIAIVRLLGTPSPFPNRALPSIQVVAANRRRQQQALITKALEMIKARNGDPIPNRYLRRDLLGPNVPSSNRTWKSVSPLLDDSSSDLSSQLIAALRAQEGIKITPMDLHGKQVKGIRLLK